jgi:hypothetical protein
MYTLPRFIQIGEKRFQHIAQLEGAPPLNSLHRTMVEMNQLGEDKQPVLEKLKTNFIKSVSIPRRISEISKEDLKRYRKKEHISFGKKLAEKHGA